MSKRAKELRNQQKELVEKNELKRM